MAHDFLWSPLNTMVFFYELFGWFEWGIKFYIEHILSNLMWMIYPYGIVRLFLSIFDKAYFWSYVSFLFHVWMVYVFASLEVYYGTDAIRWLDNDYYADPYLKPSLFYLLGISEHEYWDEVEYKPDDTQSDDIPIEEFRSVIAI